MAAHSLRLSVSLPNYAPTGRDWSWLLDAAQVAERFGVDRITMADHVVFGERLEDYARPEIGGSAGGVQPTGPDGHFLDPLILLSRIAATTTRIRLGTSILLAALRRPIVLAKQVATLDVLSGGRLDLGVGVGWQREEYDAAGLDFAARGRLLEHCLEVCTTLWTEQRASHHSDLLHFDNIHMMPKPLQPSLPVWVSGTVNRPAMQRLAKFGAGWLTWGPAATDPISAIPQMRSLVERFGRDPSTLMIATPLPCPISATERQIDEALSQVGPMAAAGVTDFRLQAPDHPSAWEEFLSMVVPRFRAITDQIAR